MVESCSVPDTSVYLRIPKHASRDRAVTISESPNSSSVWPARGRPCLVLVLAQRLPNVLTAYIQAVVSITNHCARRDAFYSAAGVIKELPAQSLRDRPRLSSQHDDTRSAGPPSPGIILDPLFPCLQTQLGTIRECQLPVNASYQTPRRIFTGSHSGSWLRQPFVFLLDCCAMHVRVSRGV